VLLLNGTMQIILDGEGREGLQGALVQGAQEVEVGQGEVGQEEVGQEEVGLGLIKEVGNTYVRDRVAETDDTLIHLKNIEADTLENKQEDRGIEKGIDRSGSSARDTVGT